MSTEGIWNTDDASASDVIRMLRFCASTWVPEARLLGNVRASDIVRACDEMLREAERPADGWRPIDTLDGDGPVTVIREGWLPHTAQRIGSAWLIPGTEARIPFQPTYWREVLKAPEEK